jgi:adenosylcobinamide-phosphate synthase
MKILWLFALALALDLGLGDPAWAWHPVRLIGQLIKFFEGRARQRGSALRRRGIGLALFVVGLTWLLATAALRGLEQIDVQFDCHAWLWLAGAAVLLKSSFAIRDLLAHARAVQRELDEGDLARARLAVGRIVGRDVSTLDERGVRRACLESVAESLGDGVVAPLFYAALGGPALALAYRAINTLDSMVGYKDEHYLELGWASAKLDDLASWVPARLAALITALAAGMLGLDAGAALKTALADAPQQPSPNAGWPEGAFAGALGVQLGGPVSYRGRSSVKATLGAALQPLDAAASAASLRLYACASGITVFLAALLSAGLDAWMHGS